METEVQRLREENADLRKRLNESSSLETAKKKAEARVEQLEQKVRSESTSYYARTLNLLQMDELIQEKVSQKENELNATYDEKIRNYEERYVHTVRQASCCNVAWNQRTRLAKAGHPHEEPAP